MLLRGTRVATWFILVLVVALGPWQVAPAVVSAQAPTPQGPSVQAPSDEAPPAVAPGEILVRFRPGTPGQTVAETHRQNDGQAQRTIPRIDIQVVQVPVGQEAARVAAYARNPNVLFAELHGSWQAISHGDWADSPNDPHVAQQWQYNNTAPTSTGNKNDADIDAVEAWHLTPGSATVAIAILDTGIDQDHEDLGPSKVTKNHNFTSGRFGSSTVDDKYGHGTHVAGSAAAATHNLKGVAGTCPRCVMYGGKVLGDRGTGYWEWIANGIIWAADNNAKVINLSLGGGASSTVEAAVRYAWERGAVIVAAAGNNGTTERFYPAAYDDYVIAVAATDRTDNKASFSNHGPWVDVAAPGVDILSTAPNHGNTIWRRGVTYGTLSGTSMASPHVAGVAGLIWSKTGLCTTNACVRFQLESKADKIPGTGSSWTHGRVNAYSSVQ